MTGRHDADRAHQRTSRPRRAGPGRGGSRDRRLSSPGNLPAVRTTRGPHENEFYTRTGVLPPAPDRRRRPHRQRAPPAAGLPRRASRLRRRLAHHRAGPAAARRDRGRRGYHADHAAGGTPSGWRWPGQPRRAGLPGRQARRARSVEDALVEGLGVDYVEQLDARPPRPSSRRRGARWSTRSGRPQPRGPGGRGHRLRRGRTARAARRLPPRRRRPSAARPVLLQVHGGGWTIGSKDQQGIPLMQHLAAKGWVCVAINYRLSPRDAVPGPGRRREAGHRLDQRAHRGVRRRPRLRRDHRRLRGRPPVARWPR